MLFPARCGSSLAEEGEIIMAVATLERRPTTSAKVKPVDRKKEELRAAAERVYRKYGTDLTAFRRDIERELEKRAG
jgi:hypothetical protein